MPQEPQSREYINGMLAALNIAMIYARDTERRMTEEDIQGEIETVMNIPVKSEPKKSESAIHNLELKERNEALSEFNQKVEKANMLTNQLAEAIDNLPIFSQQINGGFETTIDVKKVNDIVNRANNQDI